MMESRTLAGQSCSVIGLGTSPFGKQCDSRTAAEVVRAAIANGITHFDTADSYGAGRVGAAEQLLGRALRGVRDQVVVVSKVGTEFAGLPASLAPSRIRAGIEGSLRRLGTDYLDGYLLHVPDSTVPVEDVVDALSGLVEAGLVRTVGAANHEAAFLTYAGSRCPSFSLVQDEYSVLCRGVERSVLPACRSLGLGLVCYAPLAEGLLSGKYHGVGTVVGRLSDLPQDRTARWRDPVVQRTLARFLRVSEESGIPPTHLALRWLIEQPGVVAVIPAATSAAQVEELAAAGGRRVEPEVLNEVTALAAH
jgi:1-deoxyxylulose-5-phosphate synthase